MVINLERPPSANGSRQASGRAAIYLRVSREKLSSMPLRIPASWSRRVHRSPGKT